MASGSYQAITRLWRDRCLGSATKQKCAAICMAFCAALKGEERPLAAVAWEGFEPSASGL